MTVTPAHIERVADFLQARIYEQLDENETRYFDKEPVSRALRSLRRVVDGLRAKKALAGEARPELAATADLVMTLAWGDLASMAKEWSDHPDFLPEFDMTFTQLSTEPSEGS